MHFEFASRLTVPTIRELRRAAHVLPLMLLACHDEARPPDTVTLANAWPNQDGRLWIYEATVSDWSTQPLPPELIFATRDEVPAAPSLRELVGLLDETFTGPPISTERATYSLQFVGRKRTHSGASGQNLVETLAAPIVGKAAAAGSFTDRLLARLAAVRPDVRARIGAGDAASQLAGHSIAPLFLHGGAWEKTDEWIGTYGDANAELAWLYLDDDLDLGHEFEFQLLPDFTDDTFLRARVHRNVRVETAAGVFENALEVIYQLDTGVTEFLVPGGGSLGYIRIFDIARVIYAAGVGPVYCEERLTYVVGEDLVVGPAATREVPLLSTRRPQR